VEDPRKLTNNLTQTISYSNAAIPDIPAVAIESKTIFLLIVSSSFLSVFSSSPASLLLIIFLDPDINNAVVPNPIFTEAAANNVVSNPYILMRKNPARTTPITAPSEFKKYNHPISSCA